MAKRDVKKGSADVTVNVFVQDVTSLVGAGLTGLVYNSSGLTCYYVRERAAAAALTLATLSAVDSAHSDGGFKEIDSTNMPGMYRLDLSDAAVASGSTSVVVMLKGAANMAPCLLELNLVDYDPYDSVKLGLSGMVSIKKNAALSNFEFFMADSSDHISGKTGLTITAQRSIDGGAFAACANGASEVSAGIYKINLADTDLNGDVVTLKFTATGADPTLITIKTEA